MRILLVSTKYSSKGLGFQPWTMIMKFLIDNYKPRKISTGTVKRNIKMISTFEKSCMIYNGFKKNNF
jgi:hypothetical protein